MIECFWEGLKCCSQQSASEPYRSAPVTHRQCKASPPPTHRPSARMHTCRHRAHLILTLQIATKSAEATGSSRYAAPPTSPACGSATGCRATAAARPPPPRPPPPSEASDRGCARPPPPPPPFFPFLPPPPPPIPIISRSSSSSSCGEREKGKGARWRVGNGAEGGAVWWAV